jgi:hypothetical protein
MLCVTFGLLSMVGFQTDTSYGAIVWRLMLTAAGMGLVMAPATDSVMGSLPLAKAGVGSAVNDTTRQVGGALGVAIIGSVLSSSYGSGITQFFVGKPVPPDAVAAAGSSIGGAFQVAAQAPAGVGSALVSAANTAFLDGFHHAVLVGAVITLLGTIVALAFLPARATRPEGAHPHDPVDRADPAGGDVGDGARASAGSALGDPSFRPAGSPRVDQPVGDGSAVPVPGAPTHAANRVEPDGSGR